MAEVHGNTLRRARWLGVLESVLALGWVCTIVAGLGQLLMTVLYVWSPDGPNAYAPVLPVWNAEVPLDGVLAPGVSATVDGVDVRIQESGLGVFGGLLYLLTWLPGLLTGGLALWWLYRILAYGRANTDELFSAGTAAALRRVGWTLIIGTLAANLLGILALSVLSHLVLVGSEAIVPVPLSYVTLVAGVAALAVSEVVRRGVELVDEVRGTI